MNNILLLTSLYPSDDVTFLNNTSVCHYFAKEWKSMGYNVRVFFMYNSFPLYFYPFLKIMNRTLANKSGIAVLDKYLPREYDYILDGINVTRIPIKKSRPRGSINKRSLESAVLRIQQILAEENFLPEVILSHFLHPSLEIVSRLKPIYKVPCAISLHGKEKYYSVDNAKMLQFVDYIGYRCVPIGRSFEKLYGQKPHFYCFSGVPSEYVVSSVRTFKHGIKNYIYVGSLINRKHPVCLISAISNSTLSNDFSITYVGDGAQKNDIEKEAIKYSCLQNIRFTGCINRDAVVKELDKADVFIMLSSDETFGLVYLEAMARGCIVIASSDEGMDGIIVSGVNGFLCKAGDSVELSNILSYIKSLSTEKHVSISKSAIETARKMNDKKMAEEYINYFKNILDNDER